MTRTVPSFQRPDRGENEVCRASRPLETTHEAQVVPHAPQMPLPSAEGRLWPQATYVRGAFLAKGPDSSLGEVHRGSCSEDIHLEEEKVGVKVQEEEVEDRERQ